MTREEVAEEGKLVDASDDRNNPLPPVTWMSLPNKTQLLILAICRLSEPLSNTCLLPYIYYLLRSLVGSSDTAALQKISHLSGLLVAAFPLAQFSTSVFWAWMSDTYGRKPIIMAGLIISIFSNLAFGFSKTFGALLFWRFLAGIGNGHVGVMRTMTAEIVKERRYQTRAFLLLPLIFNSGMVIALGLGGCLADPVINLPWLFGPNGILNITQGPEGVAWMLRYPYALPTLSNAITLVFGLFLSFFGMKETLPGKEQRDLGRRLGENAIFHLKSMLSCSPTNSYTALDLEDMIDGTEEYETDEKPISCPDTAKRPPRPSFSKIWTRDVFVAIVSFSLLPLHNAAFMHVFPVFLSAPAADNPKATIISFSGGLGLASPSIGLWLSFFGVCGILLQMFIYPRLQAKLGTLGCFRLALFIFPMAYLCAPYLSFLSHRSIARWICVSIIICAQIMARTIAIPSTVILLTNSAPSKNMLATIHGFGGMLSSLARAVGTAAGGAVYAWGMKKGVVGAVWWLYLTLIAMVALAWSFTMRPCEGGRPSVASAAKDSLGDEVPSQGSQQSLLPRLN